MNMFREPGVAGPTGIEPAAYGLRVRRSSLTELRARMLLFERGSTEKYRGYGQDCGGA
jgi:hypothetical protein